MKILFTEHGWEDYLYWQKTNPKQVKRINEIIKDIQRSPFVGIGKPEQLRFNLSGFWSRRIDHEHRIVYKVDADKLVVLQCRYHYE